LKLYKEKYNSVFSFLFCVACFSITPVFSQLTIFAELTGNPVVTMGWNLTNQAVVSNEEIVLTPNLNDKSGAIFYSTPIDFSNGGKFIVDFEFRIYDGNAADGLALNVITQLPDGSPQGGGGIGVSSGSTGLKIVFDTYDNCSQNDNPEIQVFNGTGYAECGIPTTHKLTNQSYLRSSSYQPARFVYDDGTVYIYINCELKLTVSNVNIQNSGYFGFSSATGGQRDRHSVKNVKIYATTPSIGTKYVCSGVNQKIGVANQSNNTYLWEAISSSDNVNFLNDATISNPTFSMINDGDTIALQKYLLTTTINSSTSCPIVIKDTVYVKVYQSLKVKNITTKFVCASHTVTATATVEGGMSPFSYEWINLTETSSFESSLQASNLLTGSYLFTFTDFNECKDTMSIDVEIPKKLNIDFKAVDSVLCRGDSTLVSINYVGEATPISIFGSDEVLITSSTFWASPQEDSLYVVVAIDSNKCTDTAKFFIKSIPLPVANFEATLLSGCMPFTTSLHNLSVGNVSSCLYTLSDGRNFSSCEPITFASPGCYDVALVVNTPESCADTLVYYDYLCAFPNPIASFNVSPHDLTPDDRTVQTENLSVGAENYYWDFGDNSPMNEQESPVHIYPNDQVGTFLISLLVISEHGCSDTATDFVNMQDVQQIYAPNTFSPNDDPYNQLFLPVITSPYKLSSYRLEIYDRWGERVFETEDIYQGWDGKYKDVVASDGMYIWKIFVEGNNSVERKTYIGHVYLLR